MKLEHTEEATSDNVRRIVSDLVSDKYHSYDEMEKTYKNINVVFDSGLAMFENTNARSNFQEWKEKLRQSFSSESFSSGSYKIKIESVAEQVVRAFEHCVTQQSTGFRMWSLTDSKDPRVVTISTNYMSSSNRAPTMKLKQGIRVMPVDRGETTVTCTRNRNVADGAKIGSKKENYACIRSNQQATLVATMVTDDGGSPKITVSGVPKCTPEAFTERRPCPYPQAGNEIWIVKTCVSGDPLKKVRAQDQAATTCGPTDCRNAEDIVKALAQGMFGGPLLDSEVPQYAKMPKEVR